MGLWGLPGGHWVSQGCCVGPQGDFWGHNQVVGDPRGLLARIPEAYWAPNVLGGMRSYWGAQIVVGVPRGQLGCSKDVTCVP